MLQQKVRSGAAALLAALTLGLVAPAAWADVYVGNFDPAYGAPFTGLGWHGTATYDVPGNCGVLPAFTGFKNNAVDCGGTAVVRDALVEFYDTSNPLVTIGTVSWASAGPNIAIPGVVVNDLEFVAGDLVQLRTNLFPYDTPAPPNPLYFSPNVDFALQFFIAENIDPNAPGQVTLYSGPLLYYNACLPVGSGVICSTGRNNAFDNGVEFTITRVPEPASLALVAGALLAGAGTRRRARAPDGAL